MAPVPHPRFCTCCSPAVAPAPAFIWNRQGLAQVAYRIGTFASFRQAMLGEIHCFPELTGLLTRESDDHAITLVELFAAMGDVLTFYNERIANEMFLGQALHKASVEQLVALVGYIPRPALSATGVLSFEIEPAKATRLRRGLKVMSVPGPDETAQVFETLEEIRGHGRLNAASAFAPFTEINALDEGRRRAPVIADAGVANGERFVIFGRGAIEEKEVEAVEAGPGGTWLSWQPAVQNPDMHPRFVRTAAALRRLRFFGHNAPASHNVYNADPTVPPQQRWTSETIDGAIGAATLDYPLDGRLDDLKPGAHLLLDAGPTAEPRLRTARVTITGDAAASLGPLSDTVTHIRVRQTVTGHPAVAVLPDGSAAVLVRTGGGHPAGFEAIDTPQDLFALGSPVPFVSSDLAGISPGGPRFDVFVRDAARRLRQATWSPGWSAWIDHGGILTSAPVPVALAGGQVRVFVRGPAASGLWMFDATGAPVPPVPLGGILASPPTAVTPDGARIAVFVRGPDDALWWRHFDGAAWAEWESLGGRIDGTPAAAVSGAGAIDVFARGLDAGLMHFRRGPAGWAQVRDLGGNPAGNPAATGGAPDWAMAAVRQRDGTLAFITRSGATWSDWDSQDGAAGADPAMAATADGVYVAVRHDDGAVATLKRVAQPAWVRHGGGFGFIPDRRATRLYEIGGSDIAFRRYDYPETAEGGWLALPLEIGEDPAAPDGLGALDKGRKVIVAARALKHRAKVMQTLTVAATPGGRPDHLLVGIEPALPRVEGPLTLMGNIAEASHGETQREDALGSGNAARPFQSFPVPPGEITHLPQATGVRPVPQVDLRAEGVLWQEVPHLYGRGVKQRAYTLRLAAEGDPVVTGGDGVRAGARFPTGALNVRLTRRLGAGLAGNLKEGQLSIALEKPVGLKEVANPLPSSGGAPGETAEDARHAAPDGVRTFGRIVSLQDFAALATASGLAARAYVTWVWNRMERTAHLTVAGPGGAVLSPENLALLHAQLSASRDPNRPLLIANLVRVPIVVQARLLRDPAREADAVAEAARQALLAAFAFEVVGIGRPVHLSDVFAVLQGVAGVTAADVDLLHLREHMDLSPAERAVRSVSTDPVQPHIRLYAARPTPGDPAKIDRYQSQAYLPGPPPAVLPAEQAFIADPARDIALTLVEAF